MSNGFRMGFGIIMAPPPPGCLSRF